MKSLEHELHCSVCKEIVKQPVVLPCQHSVCLMCASEVLVANGYPPPDLPPEPKSPASTPNTRSPRQARRPTPKAEQRPIDRVLRSGKECIFVLIFFFISQIWEARLVENVSYLLMRSSPAIAIHASFSWSRGVPGATPQGGPTSDDDVPLHPLQSRRRTGREGPHRLPPQPHAGANRGEVACRCVHTHF